jgi:hypothetical protein
MLFAIALTLPYSSARLSLILHGHPFAHVVPKEKLDIFQFVKMDSFSYKAVVFSDGKPVGMIDQPNGAFASYDPFPLQPDSVYDDFAMLLWVLRWFLLPVQAVLLFIMFYKREIKAKNSNP